MEKLWDLVAESGSSTSVEALNAVLQKIVLHFDIEHYLYLNFNPLAASETSTGNYPASWIQHYIEQGYQHIDPTAYCCRVLEAPFTWESCDKVLAPTDKTKKFWREAKEYSLVKGFGIPARSSDGSPSGWGITFPKKDDERRWLERYANQIAVVSNAHHYRFEQLIHKQDNIRLIFRLTGKELECMTWLCAGKTYWETGVILSISERTVRFHINSVRKKMDVSTNAQLIAKAVLYRLVQ